MMRLLIVDDQPEVRKALRRLLTVEDFDVCGEAADGLEAIQATRRLHPDLIVMDLLMPHMTGIEAAHEIRNEFPSMLIMLVTPEPSIVEAARNAGIRGTVSKMALANLVPGIRAVLRGEEFHRLGEACCGSPGEVIAGESSLEWPSCSDQEIRACPAVILALARLTSHELSAQESRSCRNATGRRSLTPRRDRRLVG